MCVRSAIPRRSTGSVSRSLFSAATLLCVALPAEAGKVTATADIRGCEDARIWGSATLTEEKTEEGIKEVTIHLKVKGLSDGNQECE